MGLYDNILVEGKVDLPGLPIGCNRRFQTKNLDNLMSIFKITNEGRLIEKVPSTIKYMWRDTKHHGDVTFYTNYEANWYEFTARFTDGQLTKITAAPVKECAF